MKGNNSTRYRINSKINGVTISNLSIGYNKDEPIINSLNYWFDEGKIYGLLGESGVGKTTLLRTIAGLNRPLGGECWCKSKPYMMHQNYTCFDWLNCYQNIEVAAKVKGISVNSISTNDRIYRELENVGLLDYIGHYPTELSGGMRQRLALARTLFVNPEIILMDEPLSALDEKTRLEMQDLIIKNHKETNNTIIIVTHSSQEAERMCDEIIYLTRKGMK